MYSESLHTPLSQLKNANFSISQGPPDDYFHKYASSSSNTIEELDVHTFFTTNQLSTSPRSISKILFFSNFFVFLEQNQLYFCLNHDYESISGIHESLIIDICIMSTDLNQLLLLQENGEISVLFIILQDQMTATESFDDRKDHSHRNHETDKDDTISDIGESKMDRPPSPLIHLSRYSSILEDPNKNSQAMPRPPSATSQQAKPTQLQRTRSFLQDQKLPTLIEEPLHINIQKFGFILTPQMIFNNFQAGGGIGGSASSNQIMKLQYFSNSSMIILSNQIKCSIIQLKVNENDGSIGVEQSFDIEDQFLSYSIISSVWMSENFYHILSCNNDSTLNVTILPKDANKFQLTEEEMRQLSMSDSESDEEEIQPNSLPKRKPIFHQLKLSTKHKSWISSLSICSSLNCYYGLSGDIDGQLILWIFDEKNYSFINTRYLQKRLKQIQKKRKLLQLSSSLLSENRYDEDEILQKLQQSQKSCWKILWHDKNLADSRSITMIRLEAHQTRDTSTNAQKGGIDGENQFQHYAYIGTSHGKLIILQLFQKSYHLLHELFLFSSLGEIHSLHIAFEEKIVETIPIRYETFADHRLPPAPQPLMVQQRLRVYSAQASEAVECIVNKHIASIIKLLPTFSFDNQDLTSLAEMFDLQYHDYNDIIEEQKQMLNSSQGPMVNNINKVPILDMTGTVNFSNTGSNPIIPSFSTTFKQLQTMKQFPHQQYSRFHQMNTSITNSKIYHTSLKAYAMLLDKDMILVTDWVQYIYLYDLFSGQLIHTMELITTHCTILAAFEFSALQAPPEIEVNRDRVLVLAGHNTGAISLYELVVCPITSKKKKGRRKKKTGATSLTMSSQPQSSKVLEQDDEEEDNGDVEAGGDEKMDAVRSLQPNESALNSADMAVFDLLEDSGNLLERRYSLESNDGGEGGIGEIGFLSISEADQSTSLYSPETSLAPSKSLSQSFNRSSNQTSRNPIQRLSNHPHGRYYCESKLILTIPTIHCPVKITHLFFSSHGNHFISIHMQKYLFLYASTPPPPELAENLHLTGTRINIKGNTKTADKNSAHERRYSVGGSRSLILKYHVFGEGLRHITILQPLQHDDFQSSTRPESSGRKSVEPERLMLVLQYADRIELFNALACEIIATMSLHDTTVLDLIRASYLWYYSANEKVAGHGESKENKLIGLSIQGLSSVYSCSYGKGFEKILSSASDTFRISPSPLHVSSSNQLSSASSWEYLLQGLHSFTSLTSPLLGLWSMKRCSLLRVHFQSQNNSIHIMRTKQFETKVLPNNKNSFVEILGAQSLKMISWIRNHRGIIILSNGYAVIVRF